VATRHMYAAPHRRTTYRVVRLDVPTPSWMRPPGECPSMFALESAMDELAAACGIDPVEKAAERRSVIQTTSWATSAMGLRARTRSCGCARTTGTSRSSDHAGWRPWTGWWPTPEGRPPLSSAELVSSPRCAAGMAG
jgi:hypothetical protein